MAPSVRQSAVNGRNKFTNHDTTVQADLHSCQVFQQVNGTVQQGSDFQTVSTLESVGALAYVLLGLAGLALTGSFLYNVGGNLYGLVPQAIAAIFSYPDVTHAGIVPYLNIAVGLKVFVGLSAVVIAFSQFKKLAEEEE